MGRFFLLLLDTSNITWAGYGLMTFVGLLSLLCSTFFSSRDGFYSVFFRLTSPASYLIAQILSSIGKCDHDIITLLKCLHYIILLSLFEYLNWVFTTYLDNEEVKIN